ncbi:hypothetical protein JHK87_022707 [Glycine soja]|nr:hypothetical protein JHK87_022707 [Glycine soja]
MGWNLVNWDQFNCPKLASRLGIPTFRLANTSFLGKLALEKTHPPPKPNPMSSLLNVNSSLAASNQHRHEAFRFKEKIAVLLEIFCETHTFQERVEPIVDVSVQIGDGDDDVVLGEE